MPTLLALRYMNLGEDFTGRALKAVAQDCQDDTATGQVRRLERELEALRLQHRLGDISDEEYIRDREKVRLQLVAIRSRSTRVNMPNLERASELLNSLPALWQHPGVEDTQRQQLLRELFEEVGIRGSEVVAVRPRALYAPHFAYLALGTRGCLWSGRVDSTRRSPNATGSTPRWSAQSLQPRFLTSSS